MTRGPRTTRRTSPAELEDHVDRLLREWAVTRPDLDVAPIAVVYRVTRLAAEWNGEIDRVFAKAGMTNTDFAVLANLRRAGHPHELNQREIMAALRLTSGTVSVRIDKLVERGYVKRFPDPADARATLVRLTDAGSEAFDAVAPEHLANEARLVAALSTDEQATMSRLLKTLLVEIEQPNAHRPDRRIGINVAAAPVGQQRRAAVGLPPQPGLLVDTVFPGGPAAVAGIHAGDLIIEYDATPVRSLSCLERALGASAGPSALTLLRNGRRHSVSLTPAPT